MSIKPSRLRQGDEIGIITPAGPVTPSELKPAIDLLTSMGYRVKSSIHLYKKKDYLAGDDYSRLEDLHSMFQDKRIKAILCARGGYGTLRLLDKIDYDLIRKNPKIIIGYSDITALLLAIYKKTRLVTFHGPMVRELAKDIDPNHFFNPLTSQQPLEFDLSKGSILVPGTARGILIGGNLSLISHMVGTPFMPTLEGSILIIEERGELPYRVDRMLTHLRLSGILKSLSGLVAGSFENCGDGKVINQLLIDIGIDLNIPVFCGLPVGHSIENFTLPLGLPVELDTENSRISFLESCVTE